MSKGLGKEIIKQIDAAVHFYIPRIQDYNNLAQRVNTDFTEKEDFKKLIHSSKFRPKDPEHLRNKLIREAYDALKKRKEFDITKKNVFSRVNDLAGVRFLHLHTQQMKFIHPKILDILKFHNYKIVGKPVAFIWDIENKSLLEEIGLKTVFRPSLYASVHYVIKPSWGNLRCEIQVRTLMEEVWGEVSHTIDYPEETKSIECREQLRVLARVASGGTRLVDSIFVAFHEYEKRQKRQGKRVVGR
jgi:ppGpp synthetase/RelA/SpoT-type nucleotidyltranferase